MSKAKRNQTTALKLVGYCRVSTDNQKEEGTIQIQEHALKEHAEAKGYTIVEIFKDEGVSGGLELRPALSQMIDCLEERQDVDGVLIFKLDRLARDLYIQEHLFKKFEVLGKSLYSIKEPHLDSDDPMRKAFRQFMGIVSELEKAFITMRLSGGRINKARKGGYAGGSTALGYRAKNKELEIDDKQAATVKLIFKMRRQKHMGFSEIARELNQKAISTARNGKWYASTVKYILENPIYRGIVRYKDKESINRELRIK